MLMATETSIPRELPDDDPEDVLFNNIYGARTIELNRPKKGNSLNGSMIRKIIPRLLEWEKSDMVNAVIMKGAREKALCAGGDVAALAEWNQQGAEGRQKSKDYFGLEYKLDHLIATYSKPYVSFMDGITMGGGVGLSVHAPFRIATERTRFAMPETRIGFFPDVGASFFLPRVDGQLGKYLALTSEELKGVQAYYHGVATHYIHSSSLPDLELRLSELTIPDYAPHSDRLSIVAATISEFTDALPHDQPMRLRGPLRTLIDSTFSARTVEQIIESLQHAQQRCEKSDPTLAEWAARTLDTLSQRSPTSLKVANHQIHTAARDWDIAQTFEREHCIAGNFMEHPDFVEGVTKQLGKQRGQSPPQWQPARLEDVKTQDVEAMFRPSSGATSSRLELLNKSPAWVYREYPWAGLGLPSQRAVQEFVRQRRPKSKEEVLERFARDGKFGTVQVVEDILERKTGASESGDGLVWYS
ncbi:MAG: hypothetical protein M1831_004772 [Alyxoria varia]|nr:MAG: hypothetical protein M1831_004772 [Alyxoria varia]